MNLSRHKISRGPGTVISTDVSVAGTLSVRTELVTVSEVPMTGTAIPSPLVPGAHPGNYPSCKTDSKSDSTGGPTSTGTGIKTSTEYSHPNGQAITLFLYYSK